MSMASWRRPLVDTARVRPRPQVLISAKKGGKQKSKGFQKNRKGPAPSSPAVVEQDGPGAAAEPSVLRSEASAKPDSMNQAQGDTARPAGSEEPKEYRPNLDLLASGADAQEELPAVSKGQVLGACFRISAGMLLISLPAREYVRASAAINMGTSQEAVDRLLAIPGSLDVTHILAAVAAAGAVTAARTALLQVWPEFASATDRSNKQVLSPLGPLDLLFVCFLPGISEEALFRGTFIPATFPDWRGALLAGAAFGVLHNNGGRNWAFAGWAGAVGAFYGALFLYTEDITSPMLAHSLANLASAAFWLETRSGKGDA